MKNHTIRIMTILTLFAMLSGGASVRRFLLSL
jgi:hypothetical protein